MVEDFKFLAKLPGLLMAKDAQSNYLGITQSEIIEKALDSGFLYYIPKNYFYLSKIK